MVNRPAIANLFARSPVKPLQHHMEVVLQCVSEVVPLFETLITGDRAKLQTIVDKIFALEAQADTIKHDLRDHLPKSLMLSMNRTDLLKILSLQDKIADTAQDIAGLLQVRQFDVPGAIEVKLMQLIRRCLDACILCHEIINELDELVAVGFQGPETEKVEAMVQELNQIESETDQMGTDLNKILFQMEDEMNPVSLILWTRLIRDIGTMADQAERVGNRLRLFFAR